MKQKLIKIGIFALALILAFLVGFIPMWIKANNVEKEHEATQLTLKRSETSNLIARAIVDARRGEYETARQGASDFYTSLRAEIEKSANSAFTASEKENLKVVFIDRDALITMLAQRDPASVGRLTDTYLTYQQALGATITSSATRSSPNANVSSNNP